MCCLQHLEKYQRIFSCKVFGPKTAVCVFWLHRSFWWTEKGLEVISCSATKRKYIKQSAVWEFAFSYFRLALDAWMCLKKVCVKWKIQYDRCLRSLVEIFFFFYHACSKYKYSFSSKGSCCVCVDLSSASAEANVSLHSACTKVTVSPLPANRVIVGRISCLLDVASIRTGLCARRVIQPV